MNLKHIAHNVWLNFNIFNFLKNMNNDFDQTHLFNNIIKRK